MLLLMMKNSVVECGVVSLLLIVVCERSDFNNSGSNLLEALIKFESKEEAEEADRGHRRKTHTEISSSLILIQQHNRLRRHNCSTGYDRAPATCQK